MVLKPIDLLKSYGYLKRLYPFSAWNLPSGDEVEFRITRSREYQGKYTLWSDDTHSIYISSHFATSTQLLDMIMAHEMVHLSQEEHLIGHGVDFDNKARVVCASLGYDLRKF